MSTFSFLLASIIIITRRKWRRLLCSPPVDENDLTFIAILVYHCCNSVNEFRFVRTKCRNIECVNHPSGHVLQTKEFYRYTE